MDIEPLNTSNTLASTLEKSVEKDPLLGKMTVKSIKSTMKVQGEFFCEVNIEEGYKQIYVPQKHMDKYYPKLVEEYFESTPCIEIEDNDIY